MISKDIITGEPQPLRVQKSSPAGGENKGVSIFVDEPETADLIGKKTTQLESLSTQWHLCKISSLTI